MASNQKRASRSQAPRSRESAAARKERQAAEVRQTELIQQLQEADGHIRVLQDEQRQLEERLQLIRAAQSEMVGRKRKILEDLGQVPPLPPPGQLPEPIPEEEPEEVTA